MLAIHRRFVDRFVGSSVPSRVSRRWVSRSWRPPSLAWVPAVPVPHGQRYYEGTTTSGARIPDPLWFPFRVPHTSPSFVLAVALPERRRTTAGPGSFVQPVSLYPAYRMRLRTGSLRFPGDPSHTFALFPDPGRTGDTSPLAVPSMLPPVPTRRRLQQEHDFEAYPGLRCLLPTLHERRHHRPCKARFRLAGCAFAGRELNPLDRSERFQATSILLSRTS